MVHTSAFMFVCMHAGKCVCVCVCVFMGAPVVMEGALYMTYHHSCMCVSGYRREDSEQYLAPNYACGGCGYKVVKIFKSCHLALLVRLWLEKVGNVAVPGIMVLCV